MRYVSFIGRSAIAFLLAYLLYVLLVEYFPADPLGYHPPFIVFVLDTINLFIHEAGHLFFRLFGQTMYVLGGSITQCLIPLALAIVTWREKPQQVGVPLFWFGESLVNVSVYIADAPHKNLKLIKDGLIHDWNWLLSDNLELAEPLGFVIRGLGLVVCVASVVAMTYFAVKLFRDEALLIAN